MGTKLTKRQSEEVMTSRRDLSRFDKLQRIGCIACHILGIFSQADVHHILSGGRRKGHQNTIPLCPWHHRGVGSGQGPSLANGSKPFHATFGTQQDLLTKVNELIGTS
jgi:hypothetical protein